MKNIRKIIIIPGFLLILFSIVACSITSITSIEFTTTPKDEYVLDESDSVTAEVTIKYSNGTKEENVKLTEAGKFGLKVTGDKIESGKLGKQTLKVSYGSMVISYDYYVYQDRVTVNNVADLKTNIENTTDWLLLQVEPGTYTIDEVSNKGEKSDNYNAGILISKNIKIVGVYSTPTNKPTIKLNSSIKSGFLFYLEDKRLTSIILENLNLESDLSDDNLVNLTGIGNTKLEDQINNIKFLNCAFKNWGIAITLQTDAINLSSINIDTLIVENSSFTNATWKAIYVENADKIFINNNTFNECGTKEYYTFGGKQAVTVVDVNLKYFNFSKAVITNNTFKNSGISTSPNTDSPGYSVMIAVKARADLGNDDYKTVPASLDQVVIENNTFDNIFENSTFASAQPTYKGCFLILLGEPKSAFQLNNPDQPDYGDGINPNGVSIKNNILKNSTSDYAKYIFYLGHSRELTSTELTIQQPQS